MSEPRWTYLFENLSDVVLYSAAFIEGRYEPVLGEEGLVDWVMDNGLPTILDFSSLHEFERDAMKHILAGEHSLRAYDLVAWEHGIGKASGFPEGSRDNIAGGMHRQGEVSQLCASLRLYALEVLRPFEVQAKANTL